MFRLVIGLFVVIAITQSIESSLEHLRVRDIGLPKIAARYHMRNRTSHFYDRSAASLKVMGSNSIRRA